MSLTPLEEVLAVKHEPQTSNTTDIFRFAVIPKKPVGKSGCMSPSDLCASPMLEESMFQ